METTTDQMLGIGLYTVEEAALYARVPTRTMSRWLYGDRRGAPVLSPQFPGSRDDRIVTFLDFVQSLHVRQIRTDTKCKIPLDKIRRAIEVARDHYGVPYPLAMDHTTFLYGDEIGIKLGEDQYVEVTGKTAHHQMLGKIVKLYMKDLTFDRQGLADSFKAGTYCNFDILMRPAVRFGEPLLPSCGYTARTLWEATTTEGSFEAAADAYGITAAEVEAGYRHIESLASAA